eukprot:COSAG06_NODE_13576_length_1243_cov_1.857517_2_plen_98_part_00
MNGSLLQTSEQASACLDQENYNLDGCVKMEDWNDCAAGIVGMLGPDTCCSSDPGNCPEPLLSADVCCDQQWHLRESGALDDEASERGKETPFLRHLE